MIEDWALLLEEETSDTHAEIAQLSLNQRKVLKFIANSSRDNLLASASIQALGLAQSSIASAVNGLIEKDVIEKTEAGYRIINPVIRDILQN